MTNAKQQTRRRSRSTASAIAASICLAAVLVGDAGARLQQEPPDVAVPPPPSETFVKLTEAELLARLPERERALVEAVRDPRQRFDKLLDVSDMRLAAVGLELDRGVGSVRDELLLYDATLRLTEAQLRAPETRAAPRDKLYKRLERRLAKQKLVFDSILDSLRADDLPTGQSVANTVESIRIRALNSALDSEVLETPKEP
jgi:hypothetical protein